MDTRNVPGRSNQDITASMYALEAPICFLGSARTGDDPE